ncbi:zinc finger protein 774-like [Hippocampus comes]|uniref:zinc finger protein 774-like n=1 Tax=Hippocampus comes TaxID=109280 RepID=UPI00094ED09E|nr:PREDICTED: zinc finger protein 774-like [Hippocampus comes]
MLVLPESLSEGICRTLLFDSCSCTSARQTTISFYLMMKKIKQPFFTNYRTAENEEQLYGAKEDSDAVFKKFRFGSCKAVISEDLCPERQDAEPSDIKTEEEKKEVSHFKEEEEQEAHYIKTEEEPLHPCMKLEVDDPPYIKEEEEGVFWKLPLTGVALKRRNEADTGVQYPSSSSCQHMTTQGVGNQWGGSKTDGLLAPLSDRDILSNADDDDENEDKVSDGDLTCHTDKKPWKCSWCGKTFTYKSHLKLHTITHTGDKPFSCLVCARRFSRKESLKKHTRTHTGEKSFACSDCGERFSQKGEFKKHARTHTDGKPFACSDCGQRFSYKGHFVNHTRTHTGERPFACTICGKRFSWKLQLKLNTLKTVEMIVDFRKYPSPQLHLTLSNCPVSTVEYNALIELLPSDCGFLDIPRTSGRGGGMRNSPLGSTIMPCHPGFGGSFKNCAPKT